MKSNIKLSVDNLILIYASVYYERGQSRTEDICYNEILIIVRLHNEQQDENTKKSAHMKVEVIEEFSVFCGPSLQ